MPERHPAIVAFLDHYLANDKASTAKTYSSYLFHYERWIAITKADLLRVTADQLAEYHRSANHQDVRAHGKLRAR